MIWMGVLVWGLIVAFIWSLCAIAGRADDEAERMYRDSLSKE